MGGDKIIQIKMIKSCLLAPTIRFCTCRWMINPKEACSAGDQRTDEEVFLLVTIASAIWETRRRKIIRDTWTTVEIPFNLRVKVLFFVGM